MVTTFFKFLTLAVGSLLAMSAGSAVATVEWFPDNSNIGGDAGPYSICNYPNHGDRDEFPNFGWGTGQFAEDLDTELSGIDAVTETIQESAWDCRWYPTLPSVSDVTMSYTGSTEISDEVSTHVPIGHELALAKLDIQKLPSYSAVVKVEWDFDSDGLYEEVDNGPFRVRSGRSGGSYASHRFTSIGTTHSWESSGEKAVGLRVTYENSATEVVTGIVRVASRDVAGYAETLMLTDGNLRPGVLTELYLRAGSLSANEPVSIWLYPDFADATDTASPVELVSGVATEDGSLSLEFTAPESLEEGDTKTLVVTTSLGNVGFRETVTVAAPVAAPASDGWDYVYGSPGPLDYSEFLEAYPTSDGGLFLVGQWAGDFEGLSAGAVYRLFVQYRDEDGSVRWTKSPPMAGSTESFEVYGGVDGGDTLFLVTSGGSLVSYSVEGSLRFRALSEVSNGLSVDNAPHDLVFSAEVGVLVLDSSPSDNKMYARKLNSDLTETGSILIPSDLSAWGESLTIPDLAGSPSSDGSFWIAGTIARPLPHMKDALGLMHVVVDDDGGLTSEATIKHYGFTCSSWWDIPRTTLTSLWIYGCVYDETPPPIDQSDFFAFSSTDGELFGEITGLAPYSGPCEDPAICGMNSYLASTVVDYSADGRFGSVEVVTSTSRRHQVWEIIEDRAATEWTLLTDDVLPIGVVVSSTVQIDDTSIVLAGSTIVDLTVRNQRLDIQSSTRRAFLDQRSLGSNSNGSGGSTVDGSFTSLSKPERLLDTRGSGVKVGEIDGTGSAYVLQVGGNKGVPESGVAAVALNVTVVDGEAGDFGGFVTVYPCGTRPDASNLNFTSGQTIPNSVVAPVSADGEVCFYVYGKAHLLADVSGYFGIGEDSSDLSDPPGSDSSDDEIGVEPSVTAGNSSGYLRTGAQTAISVSGFRANSNIEVWLNSDPVLLGSGTTDSNGAVDLEVLIPDDVPEGSHHLEVIEIDPIDDEPTSIVIPVQVVIGGLSFEYLNAPRLTSLEVTSGENTERGGLVTVSASFEADAYSGRIGRLELIDFRCLVDCGPAGEQYFRGYGDTGQVLFSGDTLSTEFEIEIPLNAKNGTYQFDVFLSLSSLSSDVPNRCEVRLRAAELNEYDETPIDSCSAVSASEIINLTTFTVLGDDLLPPVLTAPDLTKFEITSATELERGDQLTIDATFDASAFTGTVGRLELIEFSCTSDCGLIGEQYFRGYGGTGWSLSDGETYSTSFTLDIPTNAKNGTYTFEVFFSISWTDPITEMNNRCEIRLGSGDIAEYDESSETSCFAPTPTINPRSITFTIVES